MLLFIGTTVRGNAVQFTLDTLYYKLEEGHIRLEWAAERDTIFELQQSRTADFADPLTIYRGPDLASFISGLKNGTYYYRVRVPDDSWSDTMTIEVQHQSLQLALTLFGVGCVVFLLTVFVVVNGARQANKQAPA